MSRRIRRLVLAVVAAAVVLIVGGFAVFALRGSDAPPPPELSAPAADATATASPARAGRTTWEVAPGEESFVGYRVREEFVSFGVVDAVGRTGDVSGTVEIDGDTVRAAELETDMTTLRSDESRRDNALRGRGIETDRFPTSTFELTGPFELSREPVRARGRLTLHGETRPIVARVSGQRAGDAIELAGSAPIDFADFAIEPPSVAGFVTVRDTGRLEFKLRVTSPKTGAAIPASRWRRATASRDGLAGETVLERATERGY
jgi:polyisoprenoid-binding protein YceI